MPWPYPPDGALTYVRDTALPAMAAGREWHWTIRHAREPERLIGVVSLMDNGVNNRAYWLDPAWRGRGAMTEASSAVTNYWFDVLGKEVLRVPKAVANIPSRRISERQGMRMVGTEERDYVSGRLATEIWEITAEEWSHQRRGFHTWSRGMRGDQVRVKTSLSDS